MKHLLQRILPSVLYQILLRVKRYVTWLSKSARLLLFDRSVRVRGKRFKKPTSLDIALGVTYKLHEPWMPSFLDHILKPKDVFLDVGANIGQTLVSAVAVQENIRYVCFEANPDCVTYLEQLVKKNNIANVTICPCGLSDQNGIAALWVTHSNPTSAGSTLATGVKDLGKRAVQYVSVFTLDSIWRDIPEETIAVMKIDVEGHEAAVLKGATATIERDRPVLIVEVLPLRHAEDTERETVRADVQAFLDAHGYRVYRIEKTADNDYAGLEPLPALPDTVLGDAKAFSLSDYVAVPVEKEAVLQAAVQSEQ